MKVTTHPIPQKNCYPMLRIAENGNIWLCRDSEAGTLLYSSMSSNLQVGHILSNACFDLSTEPYEGSLTIGND